MRRYYFLSNDLADIQRAEHDLYSAGYSFHQVHVLSGQDAELEKRHVHEVNPFAKLDILHSSLLGASIGVFLAAAVLLVGFVVRTETVVGWLPFVFLSIVVFIFSAWEGGFYGIQTGSAEFQRFKTLLAKGYHVLMVDCRKEDKVAMDSILAYHESLTDTGSGVARPSWLIASQKGFDAFVKSMP
ncbi:hypothetical protein [Teredinibacter haidensis]|uniref:hypothetical protein n=1 Tax=Teredinibacter haidensis TaxID=2731755 RepID=UPI000948A3C6|nr:hypothetical protein [Teredinibacter haidensis]